jgi:hypothetical protein
MIVDSLFYALLCLEPPSWWTGVGFSFFTWKFWSWETSSCFLCVWLQVRKYYHLEVFPLYKKRLDHHHFAGNYSFCDKTNWIRPTALRPLFILKTDPELFYMFTCDFEWIRTASLQAKFLHQTCSLNNYILCLACLFYSSSLYISEFIYECTCECIYVFHPSFSYLFISTA